MELLKIKPCDNTFFGSGKQFDFGVNDFIESKDVPYPSVFFGAIFTALLSIKENEKFKEKFLKEKNIDEKQLLEIGNIYLLNERNNELYIPAPMDLFISSRNKTKFGEFEKIDCRKSSIDMQYILKSPDDRDFKKAKGCYMKLKNLKHYEGNKEIVISLLKKSNIFKKNTKIGIGIDIKNRIVENDKLYRIQQTEFVDNTCSFLVEYKINNDIIKFNDFQKNSLNNFLKLGGENKICKFNKLSYDEAPDLKAFDLFKENSKKVSGKFRLVFTTDSFFEKNIKDIFSDEFEVLGISNDKPIYIGGYDIKNGNPVKMQKGYPAGTVVLLESKLKSNDIIEKLSEKLKSPKGFNKFLIAKYQEANHGIK